MGICLSSSTGSLIFAIGGKVLVRLGRDVVVIVGFVLHLGTFYAIYLNMLPPTPYRPARVKDLLDDHDRLFPPS